MLLMELAFLLRGAGSKVVWMTNQKAVEAGDVVYSLEHKMLNRGIQVNLQFWPVPLSLSTLLYDILSLLQIIIQQSYCS